MWEQAGSDPITKLLIAQQLLGCFLDERSHVRFTGGSRLAEVRGTASGRRKFLPRPLLGE